MIDIIASEIFLISAREVVFIDRERQLSPDVKQFVVVAATEVDAYAKLSKQIPSIEIVGHASLAQYEDASANIRATLAGANVGFTLIPD